MKCRKKTKENCIQDKISVSFQLLRGQGISIRTKEVQNRLQVNYRLKRAVNNLKDDDMIKPIDAIHSAGIYSSRGGRLVFITRIEPCDDPDAKPCIGYIMDGTPDNITTHWGRWSISGAYSHETETDHDIVYQA